MIYIERERERKKARVQLTMSTTKTTIYCIFSHRRFFPRRRHRFYHNHKTTTTMKWNEEKTTTFSSSCYYYIYYIISNKTNQMKSQNVYIAKCIYDDGFSQKKQRQTTNRHQKRNKFIMREKRINLCLYMFFSLSLYICYLYIHI